MMTTTRTYIAIIILMIAACREHKPAAESTHTSGAEPPTLVVVSYGGAYQTAQRAAFFRKFEAQHHVRIREEEWSGELAKLQAMVDSGAVTWDVVDAEDYIVPRAADQKLLEPISPDVTKGLNLSAGTTSPYGVAVCYWSTVLGYNTAVLQSKAAPTSWQDFWNIKKYPGARSLRKSPVSTLEFALLADGVDPRSLYPLDVDRAFRSLDKLRPHVTVWWEAGEQPAQLLSSGEVSFASAWNGRVYNAALAGKPVAFTWNQGLISADWWVIPRGTRNKKLAEQFIRFASQAEPQAEFAKNIPYGPINQDALLLVPADRRKDLPTAADNFSRQQILRRDWWNEHEAKLLQRFNQWLLQ